MSIDIPGGLTPAIARLISEGKFQSEAEVVAEGVRLVLQREQLYADVQAGIDDLDMGNRVSAEQVHAEARRRIQSIRQRSE